MKGIALLLKGRAEAGAMIYSHKVRSHTRVKGKEAADRAAKKAAKSLGSADLVQETANNDPYSARTWVGVGDGRDKAGHDKEQGLQRQYGRGSPKSHNGQTVVCPSLAL